MLGVPAILIERQYTPQSRPLSHCSAASGLPVNRPMPECPLMAQSGHWADRVQTTAFDPKRTLAPLNFQPQLGTPLRQK
jgi:hypothetical protein